MAIERVLVGDKQTQRFIDNAVAQLNPVLDQLGGDSRHELNAPGEPGLLNGWKHYGATALNLRAAFSKGADRWVSLEGLIAGGTATAETVLFTLPGGYRPPARAHYVVFSNGGTGIVRIGPEGNVVFLAGSTVSLALDGIRFKAA